MEPTAFVRTLRAARVMAVLRTDRQDVAREAMAAAVRGGLRVVEFTLSVPGALDLVGEFATREGLVVGAGTVLRVAEARAAVRAGAAFLVSPVCDEAVIRAAADLGVAVIPGCHTPTELLRAHDAGAPLQKLFPAPPGGPDWLRAVLGPLPFLRLVPTNGVTPENVDAWMAAGAWAVGMVTALFPAQDLAERRWDRVEARARALSTAPSVLA